MRKNKRVPCQCCGTLFEQQNYWQKFCTKYCAKKKWREDHPTPKKDRSAAAFEPSKEVILLGRNCEVCGTPLRGYKDDKRTHNKMVCSHSCSQQKYIAKKEGRWAIVEAKGNSLVVTRPPVPLPDPDPLALRWAMDLAISSMHEGFISAAPILINEDRTLVL